MLARRLFRLAPLVQRKFVGATFGASVNSSRSLMAPSLRWLDQQRHGASRSFATTPILIPRAGESIVDGQLAKVMKKVGDRVAVDEVVATLETEKVTIEVHSTANGVVKAVNAKEGDTILIGAPLYIVDTDGAGAPAAAPAAATPSAPAAPAAAAPAAPAPSPSAAPLSSHSASSSSSSSHPPARQPMIRFTHGVRPQQSAHSASHAEAAPSPPRAPYVAPNGTKIVFMEEGFYGNPFHPQVFQLLILRCCLRLGCTCASCNM